MAKVLVVASLILVLAAALFLFDTNLRARLFPNARRHFGVSVGLTVDPAIAARVAVVPRFVLLAVLGVGALEAKRVYVEAT